MEMKKTFIIFTVMIFILGLESGLLIGLRQQHKQKDYMIKILMARPVQVNSSIDIPNLPKIEELK